MLSKVYKQTKTKAEISEILDANGIQYSATTCAGCNALCILLDKEQNNGYEAAINVKSCDKDTIYRIYPHEILYIAIENRRSVLYLPGKKIETTYSIQHWANLLDEKVFAQPHYSYLVNLNYVDEVTKDFVKIKYGDETHSVYTSSRKIAAFKKAFLNFYKNKQE